MNNREYAEVVCRELQTALTAIDTEATERFADLLLGAEEIFCAGGGRSGFQIRGFAMRLMHMGLKSYMVGETCTPNITDKGLLVICSGSGKTGAMVNHAKKAKEVGAKVALITINPDSPIGKLADAVIEIPTVSPKSEVQGAIKSIQPMSSLFDQCEGIYLDIMIMILMDRLGMNDAAMFGRHANLE